MALIEMDLTVPIGGGISEITSWGIDTTTYSSLHTITVDESKYALVSLSNGDSAYILNRGESKTITANVSGGYGSIVNVTFASDGKSISWTKNSSYQQFCYFTVN